MKKQSGRQSVFPGDDQYGQKREKTEEMRSPTSKAKQKRR